MIDLIGKNKLKQKIETLENENKSLKDEIKSLKDEVKSQKEIIAEKDMLIKYYEEQLLIEKRHRFGSSSEKTVIDNKDSEQVSQSSEAQACENQPEDEKVTHKRKKRKGKREEDLSGLPVERIDYELPEDERVCPECGDTIRDIGIDIRRELKLIPAQVVVVEHAAHAYSCPNCEKNSDAATIIKTETPKPLISGSLASPSLVAYIIVQKYSNGMPLYRIEKGFIYDAVNISRQTMSNWVIQCVQLYLISIYTLFIGFLLKETVTHADETTFQVLHESGRSAQSKSYEWVYRTSGCAEHQIIIYKYTETRKQEHPQEFLREFSGYLHCDGYQAYHNLHSGIIIVGCWAHARRYFKDVLDTLSKDMRKDSIAYQGFDYINRMFELERKFEKLTPDERYQARLEQSKPIADAFFAWAKSQKVLPKSSIGVAINYALSQHKYLENVFLDGRLELSNNRCERSVKPFVQGRKAWLFSNTPDGAKASSVIYSIIETAKENGLNPFHYIKYLLETLPNTTTKNLETLLPWSTSLPDYCYVSMKTV